jgi:uncharacterized coiled-coil protein SlyX
MELTFEMLFATLAAFFAIMAVLAVGTEIILDILKVRVLPKPTSPTEALAEFKKWVPEEVWGDLEQRTKYMEQVIQEVDVALVQTRIGIQRLSKKIDPILAKYESVTPANVTTILRELDARYDALRNRRLAWIRFLSLVIGIFWAVVVQVNSLELLAPIIPDYIDSLLGGPGTFWYVVAGLTLSGLGAAAGSSFWYEQLARLRQARQVVDTATQLKEQATAIASGIAAGQASIMRNE